MAAQKVGRGALEPSRGPASATSCCQSTDGAVGQFQVAVADQGVAAAAGLVRRVADRVDVGAVPTDKVMEPTAAMGS